MDNTKPNDADVAYFAYLDNLGDEPQDRFETGCFCAERCVCAEYEDEDAQEAAEAAAEAEYDATVNR